MDKTEASSILRQGGKRRRKRRSWSIVDMDETEASSIPRRFDDGENYRNVFSPLVKMAAEYDKKLKESIRFKQVEVHWNSQPNQRIRGTLGIPSSDEMPITQGDEIRLKIADLEGNIHLFRALVLFVDLPNTIIHFILQNPKKIPGNLTNLSEVSLMWNKVSFERMINALDNFAANSGEIPVNIYKKILNHEVLEPALLPLDEIDLDMPNTCLNDSQISAVKHALQNEISCIQGPPGTGKTITSSLLVQQILKREGGPILVVAPSNGSCDNMTACLGKLEVKVVRLYARSKEDTFSPVAKFSLHEKIKAHHLADQLECLKLLKDEGKLTEVETKTFNRLRNKAEKEVLEVADVIAATCIGSADRRLDTMKFKALIIDESAQASEPESLVPISKGAQKVILIGDPNQLGPNIGCVKAAQAGLSRSLYERLTETSLEKHHTLQVQYRMHPALSRFPSLHFYDNKLQDGVSSDDRKPIQSFPWPVANKPLMFCQVEGVEVFDKGTRSYINQDEVEVIVHLLKLLLEAKVAPKHICVMTPYLGQRSLLLKTFLKPEQNPPLKDITCVSIDANQGKEFPYVLLSTVRSQGKTIGFLGSKKRLNVALTRSSNGLIIVGNPKTLGNSETWTAFLTYCAQEKVLVNDPGSLVLTQMPEDTINEMEITTI